MPAEDLASVLHRRPHAGFLPRTEVQGEPPAGHCDGSATRNQFLWYSATPGEQSHVSVLPTAR